MAAPYRACVRSRSRRIASVHRCATSLLPAGPPTPLQHRLEDVSGQARIFPEAAYGIGVPVTPEGDVHAQMMAGRSDDIAELLVDTKKHLELVGGRGKPQVADDPECFPDHQFVVSRDADV